MRHKKKRVVELSTGVQKKQLVLRNLLTSLITHGQITTTSKRSKALKSYADTFFARLVRIYGMYEEKDARREAIRLVKSRVYTADAGKKVIDDILPRYIDAANDAGFVRNIKMGPRLGDAAEQVLVRLV